MKVTDNEMNINKHTHTWHVYTKITKMLSYVQAIIEQWKYDSFIKLYGDMKVISQHVENNTLIILISFNSL